MGEWGNFLGHICIKYGVTTASYIAVACAATRAAVGTFVGPILWLRNDASWRKWLLGGVLGGVAVIPLAYTATIITALSIMTIQDRPIPWPRALRAGARLVRCVSKAIVLHLRRLL